VITAVRRIVVLERDSSSTTLALHVLRLSVFWRPITLQVVTIVSEKPAAHVFKIGWKLRPEYRESMSSKC
jgi:hypothetical protein